MATNVNRYILKLAIGAALAYAIGNALQTRRMGYVLYGAILCIHPIAGDTLEYVLDKLKAAAFGATCGMAVNIAFQGNPTVTLPIGLTALIAGGYWFNVPKRVLIFSAIVIIMALGASYSNEPFEYIGLRFWNIFLGSLVGISVNIAFWPNRDREKLPPAFARAIASIGQLYDRVINDYREGNLAANAQTRKQLRADIEQQFSAIESLLGNAKNELWFPFTNAASYQRWMTLYTRVKSLFWLVADLGLALEGGDGDRLYRVVQPELEALIEATRATFARFSQPSAFQISPPSGNPLANLPALNEAIRDRLSQIDTADNLTVNFSPSEIKRVSASIYSLRAIASELRDLAEAIDSSVASS